MLIYDYQQYRLLGNKFIVRYLYAASIIAVLQFVCPAWQVLRLIPCRTAPGNQINHVLQHLLFSVHDIASHVLSIIIFNMHVLQVQCSLQYQPSWVHMCVGSLYPLLFHYEVTIKHNATIVLTEWVCMQSHFCDSVFPRKFHNNM